MQKLIHAFILVLAGCTAGAQASLMVSQDGLDITIDATTSGQTVTFDWDLLVGSSATANSWIGTTADALSIQLGSAGNNSNNIINSNSTTATTSANVIGAWTGLLGKVSGNGCDANNSESVCYTRLATGTGGTAMETILAANTLYEFSFDVTFKAGTDVADVLAGFHSIKFLSLKQNSNNGNWSTGNQLSQSGEFSPPTTGASIPIPGTLALLLLGLVFLPKVQRKVRPYSRMLSTP